MAEYIDREKILELISCEMEKQKREYAFSDGVHCGLERALGIVEDYPAADVAPVRYGKWLDEDFPEKMATVHGMAICSVCGELSHKAEHGYNVLSKYCPNCGAKMDKEE